MEDFNINIEEEIIQDTYEKIPEGDYLMMLDSFVSGEEDEGKSFVATLKFIITDGEYQGRLISQRYYTRRDLPPYPYTTKTGKKGEYYPEKVGRSDLGKLAIACGLVGQFKNAEQILNKQFTGTIAHKTNKKDGKSYVNLVGYKTEASFKKTAEIPFTATPNVGKTPVWMQ